MEAKLGAFAYASMIVIVATPHFSLVLKEQSRPLRLPKHFVLSGVYSRVSLPVEELPSRTESFLQVWATRTG
jgi:hypothetical protein